MQLVNPAWKQKDQEREQSCLGKGGGRVLLASAPTNGTEKQNGAYL